MVERRFFKREDISGKIVHDFDEKLLGKVVDVGFSHDGAGLTIDTEKDKPSSL